MRNKETKRIIKNYCILFWVIYVCNMQRTERVVDFNWIHDYKWYIQYTYVLTRPVNSYYIYGFILFYVQLTKDWRKNILLIFDSKSDNLSRNIILTMFNEYVIQWSCRVHWCNDIRVAKVMKFNDNQELKLFVGIVFLCYRLTGWVFFLTVG